MQDQATGPMSDEPDGRRYWTEQARERGRRAAARAVELRERRRRLQEGDASRPQDVDAARAAASRGLRQAADALERAIAAHEFAAQAHDRVADYLGELAAQGGPLADQWLAKAEAHRAAAQADREAEALEARRATAERPDG